MPSRWSAPAAAPTPVHPGLSFDRSNDPKLRSKVTDKGLALFAGDARIEWVRLSSLQLTESGAKALQSFPNLTNVIASDGVITAKVAENLAGIKYLESVTRNLTPAAVHCLAPCKSLRILELQDATDDVLLEAARCDQIAILHIDGASLTDSGLMNLKAMKRLLNLRIVNA